MASYTSTQLTPRSKYAPILSVVIPGAGQLFLGYRWRALVILAAAAISGFLVNWSLTELEIAQVSLGSFTTSWLWIPYFLYWIWNVYDAYRLSRGEFPLIVPGILFIAIILYVIAWTVTDVKLDRLVTRIDDARLVVRDLVNPDLAILTENGVDRPCSFECLFTFAGERITGSNPGQSIKASENVLDIFGRMVTTRAPSWRVRLGLAEAGEEVRSFRAGTMVETIAIGLMATIFSTILALPISFLAAHNIMSRVPGGTAVYYISRTILNIVRSVDTVVWGLIVIVWVGLGTFAGVIALTIHSVAALGKLYSEEIEHIDPGPVEALTATGANLVQTIRFGVVPQIIPSFLAYTLLRWDINMRSATVVGFVAGGGIGFFVVETIRMGGYEQYATALWAVAVVIILVDTISARMRARILADQPAPENLTGGRLTFSRLRKAFYWIVGVVLFLYMWNVSEINLRDLFQPAPTFIRLVGDFLEIDLTAKVVEAVLRQMLVTVFQALLATTFGAILAIPFSFLGARNLTGNNRATVWLYYITRSIFNVLRSIEALLYVAIFIFWVGIGPFAGMLALTVTTFALLGKLFSEAIENIETGPLEAINATGANTLQKISFGILPQIFPPFISYLIYQWDINIRMATIIGFAGGGGIGLMLSTFFGSLQYHKAGTVVAFIVVVVVLMDFTSAKLREKFV